MMKKYKLKMKKYKLKMKKYLLKMKTIMIKRYKLKMNVNNNKAYNFYNKLIMYKSKKQNQNQIITK